MDRNDYMLYSRSSECLDHELWLSEDKVCFIPHFQPAKAFSYKNLEDMKTQCETSRISETAEEGRTTKKLKIYAEPAEHVQTRLSHRKQ